MDFGKTIKDNIMWFSLISLVIGAVFVVLSVIDLFDIQDAKTGGIETYVELVHEGGDWSYWIIIVAGIFLVLGAGYLYSFIKDSREFKELIDTRSKKTFLKNYEELEELAWKLPPKYKDEFFEMKNKFNVK